MTISIDAKKHLTKFNTHSLFKKPLSAKERTFLNLKKKKERKIYRKQYQNESYKVYSYIKCKIVKYSNQKAAFFIVKKIYYYMLCMRNTL